jgi:hypothetical protein
MKRRSRDEEREQRITMEIIVDAYTPEEQAMGWYYSQGLGKVPECLVHGLVMPSSGRTRVASRAFRRSAAAMLR